jgi:hypothetical protein
MDAPIHMTTNRFIPDFNWAFNVTWWFLIITSVSCPTYGRFRNLTTHMWILCHQFFSMYFQKTLVIRYLLVTYCSLFIAHILAPFLNGPSLSYMMFLSSCNTLLHNVGSFILINVYFSHVFFTCHKHKKMTVCNHIVL